MILFKVLKGFFNNSGYIEQLPDCAVDNSRNAEIKIIEGFAEIHANLFGKSVCFWMSLQGMRDQVAVEAFKLGWASYEAPLPQLIASWSSNLPLVFVDIGANSGYYSLLSAAFGAKNVIAFEPADDIANLLDANIKKSKLDQKIQVRRIALSNKSGTSQIYYPKASHGLIETSASLSPTFRSSHEKIVDVAVDTLDNVLDDLCIINEKLLLKIDVESHDIAVLEGACHIISTKRPAIIIELLPGVEISPFLKFIETKAYIHFSLNKNGSLINEALLTININESQRDHLFLPKESVSFWLSGLQNFKAESNQPSLKTHPHSWFSGAEISQPRVIFFLAPFSVPFGGVSVILTHVEVLNRNGIAAWIAMPEMPGADFYKINVPTIIYRNFMEVSNSDICVFPEGLLVYTNVLQGKPNKRIMFCQNQYYLPFTDRSQLGFSEFHLDGVVVSSQTIKACLQDLYGLVDVPVIPCAIDLSLYSPSTKKLRQIAFMPRKLGSDLDFIRAAFVRIYPAYVDLPWVAIDRMTRQEAANVLAESAVFLSLSHKESFGLPPLEAMASGCVVAGFHGDGGREYMNEGNGWWADTGDWRACVHGLALAIKTFDQGGDVLANYRQRAMQTVGIYSLESMEKKLLDYWRSELAPISAKSTSTTVF